MNVPPPINLGSFHHVGVAVRSIRDAVASYSQTLGARVESETIHDPEQGVRICFVKLGDLRIELLEPAAEPSPVDGVLKRGVAIYHVCYEVDNLDDALSRVSEHGHPIVSPPKPAAAFGGRRVAFFTCRGLLIELVESVSSSTRIDGGRM